MLVPLWAFPLRPLVLALGRGRGTVGRAVTALGPVLTRLQLETQSTVLLLLDSGLQQQRVETGAHRLADFLDGELDDLLQHGFQLALEERDIHGAVHGVGGRSLGRSLILLWPERDGGWLGVWLGGRRWPRWSSGLWGRPPAGYCSLYLGRGSRARPRRSRVPTTVVVLVATRTHFPAHMSCSCAASGRSVCARARPTASSVQSNTTKRHFGFSVVLFFFFPAQQPND